MFLIFQSLFALVLLLGGSSAAWRTAAGWWVFAAILTNLVCIYLLVRLLRAEGQRYRDLLRFSRTDVKRDLLWFGAALLIGLPLGGLPMAPLAAALFGDAAIATGMLFQPLPGWALLLGLLFPLTIALAELPTYFGYVMSRLAAQLKNGWLAWGLASLFLAVQHSFLPFIADWRFIVWRAGMFLPFAFFVGLVLKLRPRLLPYFAILHALMDLSTLAVYLTL